MFSRTLVAAVLLLLSSGLAFPQSAANVLVVANRNAPDSLRVADRYARARGIAQDQVLRLDMPSSEEIEREQFDRAIQTPIATWLYAHAAQDRILYLVLTKGVPLRIRGSSGRNGTVASVDSELTLLYRRLTGVAAPVAGAIPNPYFLDRFDAARARLFTHDAFDIYLVARLDGFTVADVEGVIDRGMAPSREGRILLDQKGGLETAGGDAWLRQAADWLKAAGWGDRVVLQSTSQVLTGEKQVLGYYSWGSNDPAISARHLGLQFVPGALAAMFVSTDARTFQEPPADWNIGPWSDRRRFFANSPQSLTGDLIRDGVTGAAGHVAEPFLDATIRPDILFPAYASGFNLVEAFYMAMPSLSWQTVVVGDPLCTPFARKTLQPSDLDKGVDANTGWPTAFAARRTAAMLALYPTNRPEAVKAMLKAQALDGRNDLPGAVAALEEATRLDDSLVAGHMLLATMYERGGQYEKGAERYRRILASNPENALALNNLAYHLAVRQHKPKEALPLAEKAYSQSGADATVADTLGWVYHLVGRDPDAIRLLGAALREQSGQAEIHLHAAVVHAALGHIESARTELAQALKLDPSLASNPEAVGLKGRIK